MSLNNAKKLSSAKIAIKTRLALLYSIAAFILLTIIALLLYWQTVNILYKTDYQFLTDEVQTIQYILDDKPFNLGELKKAILETPTTTGRSLYHYYIRLLDNDEKPVIETPNITEILPIQKSINYKTLLVGKANFHWFNKHHKNYLLVQAPVKIHNDRPGLVEIVLDISYQHAAISDRKIVLLVILASALCSIFIGFLVARRGTESLDTLTETVTSITTTSLNQRIDVKTLPVDLVGLGKAFNQMLDRMEQSFTRLKQFSSDLAHELRNPISNLIGQSELALTNEETPEQVRQVFESNLEEFNRISHLIENILFLAKAENPHLDLHKAELNLHDELNMIVEYYTPLAEDKKIVITQDGEAKLFANVVMIRRMFSNLISNALKYTESGQIECKIISVADTTIITIKDSGIGIAEEHIPKIFDRFYRVDSARSQQTGGIGLGMPIVKSIVELHHGTTVITSAINQWTEVKITFPNQAA